MYVYHEKLKNNILAKLEKLFLKIIFKIIKCFFPFKVCQIFYKLKVLLHFKAIKEIEDYLQEKSIIKPDGKTDYLWFSLFRGVYLKYIGENICADEFFLLNNIFVSFQIDVPITIRFDSCYLTNSKSHFSVQQIRNIYLILNVQPFVQKKSTCYLVLN